MTILSCINSKGGAGKSTLLTAMARELSRENKVLLIDTDPNCSLSVIHGAYISRNQPTTNTSYDLFDGQMAFPKRINDNLWIIPSHVKMSAHGNTNDRVLLRSIREVVQETPFDYILIDSPGYKNNIFRACINASGIIVIPSKVSLQDADQTAECLDEIQNQEFDGTYGIVINDIDKKTVREDEIQALYANVLESVLQTRVPHMRGLFRMATEPGYEISGAGKKIIKSLIEEVLS